MAQEVTTIAKILEALNKGLETKPWAAVPGIYQLVQGTVDHAEKKITPVASVLGMKAFINIETAEIRTYLSKWLDEPETKDLQ